MLCLNQSQTGFKEDVAVCKFISVLQSFPFLNV